jgi:hypothetical protein
MYTQLGCTMFVSDSWKLDFLHSFKLLKKLNGNARYMTSSLRRAYS